MHFYLRDNKVLHAVFDEPEDKEKAIELLKESKPHTPFEQQQNEGIIYELEHQKG